MKGFLKNISLLAGGFIAGRIMTERAILNMLNSKKPMTNVMDEIIFSSREDAEDALDAMDELIANYGLASIADLYDLAGMTSTYTSSKYGWTNLSSAKVIRVRDGYLLKLPKAKLINSKEDA